MGVQDEVSARVGYPGAWGLPPSASWKHRCRCGPVQGISAGRLGLWAKTTASGLQRKIAPGPASREATARRIVLLEKEGRAGIASRPEVAENGCSTAPPKGAVASCNEQPLPRSVRGAALLEPGED